MKFLFKFFVIIIFIISVAIIYYEFFYIQKQSALQSLIRAAESIRDKDKAFRIYYYFNAIEFSNGSEVYIDEIEIDSILEKNFVLISKKEIFIYQYSNYFKSTSSNISLIVDKDLNIRELYQGYSFVKKNFKFSKIYVTSQELLKEDYVKFKINAIKIPQMKYADNEFQFEIQALQKIP